MYYEALKEKVVLITGGAGFIGSHLCERLLSLGCKVICVDSMNDFYNVLIKESNLNYIYLHIKKNKIDSRKFIFYKKDIRDNFFVEKVFSENRIDFIIHLAAYAGVRQSIENPSLYMDVNVNGTVNLLEAARKWEVSHFILASSSSVYGNNLKVPFSETDNVDFPISPYAASKKADELVCYTYHHLYSINVACLRFFTVFGPRQRPDLAIHKFTDLIFNDIEVPFYGDGTTERDYTYVEDIIEGILQTLIWINCGTAKFEIFNLGRSDIISLKRLIETLEMVIGKKAKLTVLPLQPGDVQRTFADISKAKKTLGYNPATDFEKGIRFFIDWYKTKVNLV